MGGTHEPPWKENRIDFAGGLEGKGSWEKGTSDWGRWDGVRRNKAWIETAKTGGGAIWIPSALETPWTL